MCRKITKTFVSLQIYTSFAEVILHKQTGYTMKLTIYNFNNCVFWHIVIIRYPPAIHRLSSRTWFAFTTIYNTRGGCYVVAPTIFHAFSPLYPLRPYRENTERMPR